MLQILYFIWVNLYFWNETYKATFSIFLWAECPGGENTLYFIHWQAFIDGIKVFVHAKVGPIFIALLDILNFMIL